MVIATKLRERRLDQKVNLFTTENTEFAESVKDFSVFLMYSKVNLFNNPTCSSLHPCY